MIRAWHQFSLDSVTVSGKPALMIAEALAYQENGNWYSAGEKYLELFTALGEQEYFLTRARVMTKAACSFETSGQLRPAGAAFATAAQILDQNKALPAVAAELFNRSAVAYSGVKEHFTAVVHWRACAAAFAKVEINIITCSESWGPLPMSAFRFHLVGVCYEAAAVEAEKAVGQEMWSVGAYWEAGRAYQTGMPNIQTYNAYRNALEACIRHYGTLAPDKIGNILPLSTEERAHELDPLKVMADALMWCNEHHQLKPGPSPTASLQTWRELRAAYHSFSVAFTSIGNLAEASIYRLLEHEMGRRIFLLEKKYPQATSYWVWKITASYGESLSRWSFFCLAVLFIFAFLFYLSGSIAPITRPFDYFYFSTITFSTLGYGDIHPTTVIGQVLCCLEVGCGFIMFGILLTLVGSRLQKL
jgi:hypothetical protein